MYVRISRLQFPVNRVEDAIRSFQDTTLPAVKALPGFSGVALQVNRQDGQVGAATFWDSRTAMSDADEAGVRLRQQAASGSGGSVVGVERYEIVLMERAAQPQPNVFSRGTTGTAVSDRLDAMIEAMRTDATPAVRQLAGFRALVMGVDRESGRFFINSIWDSATDREASDAPIQELRNRIFTPAGVSGLEVFLSEVALVEFTPAALATR